MVSKAARPKTVKVNNQKLRHNERTDDLSSSHTVVMDTGSSCKAPSNTSSKFSYVLMPVLLGSAVVMSACSQSSEYEFSSADSELPEYATEEIADASMTSVVADKDSVVDGNGTERIATDGIDTLTVESLTGDSEQTLSSQSADIQIAGKKLLITASANFKVEDVVKSSNAIEALTRQQGGYVAASRISNIETGSQTFTQGNKDITLTTYYRQADMTLRIPRVNVNKFLKQVQQQVAFLHEQQFSAQDVTLDIYREQLAAQLNSDMAAELSQERLASQNAKDQGSNVNTIAATYAARQQQELAQLEQMDIADRVKYSTISLSFAQPDISYKEVTQNLQVILEAERPSFSAQVYESFKKGWNILKQIALGLIQLWWLLVLAGAFYLLYAILKTLYRKLFKDTPRMKKLKRELMGEDRDAEKTVVVEKHKNIVKNEPDDRSELEDK